MYLHWGFLSGPLDYPERAKETLWRMIKDKGGLQVKLVSVVAITVLIGAFLKKYPYKLRFRM
jgi:hypothetical protein